jgi:hypothetical protein
MCSGHSVSPAITLVANPKGEIPAIAPYTWTEVKGIRLSKTGDTRTWQTADFVNNQGTRSLPFGLDGRGAL